VADLRWGLRPPALPLQFISVKRLSSLLVVALVASIPVIASAGTGYPVAQHQQAALAELNAARWNPAAWGDLNGIDLDGLKPKPALAFNPELTGSANFKANEVSVTGLGEEHRSLVPPFLWPNELAIEWGYDLNPVLGVDTNTIEVFYAGAMEPVLAFLGGGDTYRCFSNGMTASRSASD